MGDYSDLEQYKADPKDFITPVRQKEMDKESRLYLQAERNKPNQTKEYYASLDREIARLPKDTPIVKPMQDTFDDLEQFKAPAGYAGRGSVNPPFIGQPQPGKVNPLLNTANNSTDIGRRFNEGIVKPVMSAAIGGATGASAGTFAYLPTGMEYAYQRLQGKHPEFNKLLAKNRKTINNIREENPIAFTAGDIGGSVGLGIATGGGSVPLMAANQGFQSAVRSYTESPETTAEDAAKAAALSTATAGVIGYGTKAVGSTLKYAADAAKAEYSNRALAAIRARSEKIGRELTGNESQEIYSSTLKSLEATKLFKALPKEVLNEIRDALIPATIGAIGGATTAAASGHDPLTGATYGAAGTIAATKLKVLEQAKDAAKAAVGGPLLAKDVALAKLGTTASKYAAPALSGATQPAVSEVLKSKKDDFSDLEQYKVNE